MTSTVVDTNSTNDTNDTNKNGTNGISIKMPLHLLSTDIQFHILGYAQNPQPKRLLKDILSYYYSKHLIYYYYYDIIEDISNDQDEFLYSLHNDLYRFANKNVPMIYGYTPSFYKIFLRIPFVNPIKRSKFFGETLSNSSHYTYMVFKYIRNIELRNDEPNSIKFKINILWGLLTKRERDNFINDIMHYYEISDYENYED
jgi:hypothetical protein